MIVFLWDLGEVENIKFFFCTVQITMIQGRICLN